MIIVVISSLPPQAILFFIFDAQVRRYPRRVTFMYETGAGMRRVLRELRNKE